MYDQISTSTNQSRRLAQETWLHKQRNRAAKSEIAKAVNYNLNRWSAFTRFLDDGRIFLSNNSADAPCAASP